MTAPSADLLTEAACRWPAFEAVAGHEASWTFADLDADAGQVAGRLHDAGCGPGARVAFVVPAATDLLRLMLGAWRASATVCPVNPKWPAAARADALQHARCALAVGEPPDTAEPAPGCPHCPPGRLLDGDPVSAPPRPDDPHRLAALILTSGSTGAPKAAALSYANLAANATASNANIPVSPGDRWLLSLPLHHVAGLGVVFRCLAGGGAVAVPGPGESLETAIPRLGATHVSLVPAQLRRLLDSTEGTAALKRLKAVLLGGSALPLPLLEEAAARGLPVCTTYGLTEMASQVATTRWGDTQAPLAQAAPVLSPGSVSLGEDGAIRVRGACRFAGYWRDGALDTPFDAGGWFDTGDLGAWDAEGRLRIVGRRDNRFISGGENIHPEEVERILTALPEVEDAVVAPVPSRTWGYRPMAVVRWRTGVAPLGIDALRTRLAVHLPAYKLPDAAFAWPEALDTPGIKAPRHAVAAWLRRTIGVDPAPKTTEDGQPPTESNGASS